MSRQLSLPQVVGRRSKVEILDDLLGGIQELYENETLLRSLLQRLDDDTQRYVKEIKSKDKDKGEAGEEDPEA